jgi:hypothetical protein
MYSPPLEKGGEGGFEKGILYMQNEGCSESKGARGG